MFESWKDFTRHVVKIEMLKVLLCDDAKFIIFLCIYFLFF